MSVITSTQFLLPQAVIANGAVTGNQWSNPNNALLVDGDVAASNPNETASDITLGNYATSLPQNAVIVGLEFHLIAKRGAQTSPVITLNFSLFDNTDPTNPDGSYYPYVNPITTDLTPSLSEIVLGGSNYLFASAFTPDQINNAKFNLNANGDVSVDSLLMKVYYFIPDVIVPPVNTSGSCDDCNSPIQAQPFYLALPFKANDRFAYLQSFNYPDGTPIQYADLGSCGGSIKLVFDPAVPKVQNSNFEENAVTAVWETLPNGWVKLDFGNINDTRGLQFHTPYAADPNLRSDHDVNHKVVISDSGPFLGQYLQKCQIDSLVSAPIIIENQDVPLDEPAHTIDFRGPGVIATNDGLDPNKKIVTIAGAGGTLPPQIVSTVSNTSGSVQVITLSADLQISGLNRGVAIQVSTEESKTITSIIVGGVAAVQKIVSTDVPNNLREEQWFCQNPPLGTQTIIITMSSAAYISFGAECLNGVDPTTPVGATQSASGSSLNPSLILTTTTDYSIVIDGLGTAQTPILYTPGAGQGANWHETANADVRQGGSSVESAGLQPDPITMDYAITQNTPWVYVAMEIIGITSGGTGGGHIIQDDGVPLPQEPALNFRDFFTLTDTPGVRTNVDLDLAAIANSNTFINALTSNVNFQNAVTAFVSGSGEIQIDQTPNNGTYGLLAGAVNGTNKRFTVSLGLYPSGKLQVYLNGLIQLQGASDDWKEITPGSGTFDFNTAPITGDIITVVYQGTGGTALQTGIQFKDEGSNLGTPGTANAVNFTGPGVTATRAGNQINVNIPGGNGSGGLGSTQYLAIGKASITGSSSTYGGDRYNQAGGTGTNIRGGHIVFESGTSRIYVALNDAPNHAPTNQGTILRIFKNDFGSFYLENEISISTPNTGGENNVTARWTTNGTNIFCVYFYSRSGDYGAPYPGGIGVSKFALDGTLIGDMQIYTTATVALPHDSTAWDNSLPGTTQMAIGMIGNSLFMTYHTTAGAAEFREYDISAFPTVTLLNTYTVASPQDGTQFTFDSTASEWILSGDLNSLWKYTISGPAFVTGINKSYPEFDYGSPLTSVRPNPSQIASIIPGASSNTIYVMNGEGYNYFTSSHQNYYFNFLLSSVEFPKF